MKRNTRGMLITLLIIIIFILTIFGGAYYLLSTNYISEKIGVNLETMTDSVSVDLNRKISRDYDFFVDYVDKTIDKENTLNEIDSASPEAKWTSLQVYQFMNKKNRPYKDDLKKLLLLNVDVNFGYVNGNSGIYIEGKEIPFKNEVDFDYAKDAYYNKNVSFYTLNELFTKYEDEKEYVFFRYGDFFMYFDQVEYLKNIFEVDDKMPENYYFLFEDTGNIVFQKNSGSKNDILKQYYLSEGNVTLDYENDIYKNLINNKTGHIVLNFNGEKSFLVYSPTLKDQFDQNLFVGYAFNYESVTNSMNYLRISLIILGVATIGIIMVIVIAYGYKFYKQEQDITTYNTAQYFTKPFSIKINRKGKIVFANRSCRTQIKDFSLLRNIHEIKTYETIDDIMLLVEKQKSFTGMFNTNNDEQIYVHFVPMKMFNKYFLMGDDVTATLKEQIHNRQIANYNQVTQLPNVNILTNSLEELVKSPIFHSSFTSLVAVDIIDFAKVNRIYGYSLADRMLREVAQIINSSITDMKGIIEIYNIRTSLFVVLFKEVESHNTIITWTKNVFIKLTEPIPIKDDYLIQVEPKMGVLNVDFNTMPDINAKDMYNFVMKALDRAKNSRLTKVGIYNAELGKSLSCDQVMEEDMKKAMENDEFMMFFQPQFNTKLKKIVGFESLLRWNNPKYRLESPEHYVTLAECNGTIVELGRIINEKVFTFAKTIENTGISVSLNVSPVQLLQSGFINELLDSFKRHELKPGSIAVEITETFLMENKELMINKLKLLRENGFVIHLDDFGIGYSSLFYLKDLPVDAIKLDKEFVKHMMSDKVTKTIVTKIVQMGLSLDLELIAEGVETEKQSDTLSRMGCDVIQGYLISKAVPPTETLEIIDKYNK